MTRKSFWTIILASLWILGPGCSGEDTAPGPGGPGVEGSLFPEGDIVTADVVEDYSPPPGDCSPGDVLCAGPAALQQCDADGTGWVESLCAEGEGCDEGACVPQICLPGASTLLCIDDDSYERCNASGTAWEIVQCGAAAYCKAGTCISQLCPPGMNICKNFVQLQVCNSDGTAWVDGDSCPPGGACDNGVCLSPCEVNIKDGSYLGCDFWALDLDNIEDAEFQEVGIVVSVPAGTSSTDVVITNTSTGLVLTPAELGVDSTFVPSGEVKVFALPLGFDVDGSTTTTRTFHIETTSPATVHQFNPLNGEGVYTNDASLLLPSKVTGQQYYVMSWPHRADGTQTLRGFATVVGTQEGTTEVHVTPTSPVVTGLPGSGVEQQLNPGTTYVFNLEQGEALNLETDGEQGVDLTGTYIQANAKITVFGGHECANVPLGINACDHLEQQLFPVETWSTNYVADAFQKRSPAQVDIWRVMAGDNDVTVTTIPAVPGYEVFKLQRGGWLQFASGDSFVIDADGPIMVGHYLTGSSYPGSVIECQNTGIGNDTAIGDPAFTLAAPTKRYLDQYAVLTPTGYLENYLNVIVPNGAIVQIDGSPLTSVATPIPGTNYGVVQELVQPGVHTVAGSVAFGLTAYGYDCDVSYAYPGGLKLQALQED